MKTKKSCVLLLYLFLCINICRAIDTNKTYYIFHASGLVLSAADGTPNLHTFQSTTDQQFQFTSSGSHYYIKNMAVNKNIGKTGTWSTEYTTSTANTSQFNIDDLGSGFIRLECVDNNLYLGTDATAPGSAVYSDKSGSEMLHYWYVREADSEQLITDRLEYAIDKAESQLAASTTDSYSKESMGTLQSAINLAKQQLEEKESQEAINAAALQLQEAVKVFSNSRYKPYTDGGTYYLVHAGNRLLTYSDGKLLLKDPVYNASQQFTVTITDNGTLTLKNAQTGQYVCASGDYSTALSATANSNKCNVSIEYADNDAIYCLIKFASNSLFLGTDGTTDGSGVYSDKSGTDGKHYWQLVKVGTENQQPYHNFRNGSSAIRLGMNWLDENGNHINAHGGCVLFENGTYYWFGENYRKTPVKSNGIVCYTSKDLYNWKYECMAYECPTEALRSDYQDMNYGRTLERPKVMYNPNTDEYVMWVHWENGSGYAASRVAILKSKKITGPYTFIKTMRPRGDEQPSGSRDQTLLYDPDYQVGYHYGSAEENMTMHATLLTNDFLDLSDTWQRIFVKKQYEAPAVIKYHGRFMAITSGCTGWDPNAAHASYSELPLEGWTDLGNPCTDENANKTYNSQSNFVFQVPDMYNAYIYMGDRWKGGDYFTDANVGESWHIWLPIDMRTGYPIIRFYSQWDLSLFKKINRYRRVEQFETGREYVLLSRNANRILSDQGSKFLLTEDDDQKNITFRVCDNGNGQYLLINTKTGEALSVNNDALCWQDSTGSNDQLWQITKSGNDGYYQISMATNSSKTLTNMCATPTSNGIVGLAKTSSALNTKFAFCFDSDKFDYEPISNESDGSYDKWIQSLGYEQTSTGQIKAETVDNPLVIVGAGEGILDLKSLAMQIIGIYNTSGQLITQLKMNSDEIVSLPLPKGIYIVGGTKVIIK